MENKLIFKSLENFTSIIDTLREGFLVLDKNLNVIFANKTFYEVFKVNKKNTIGEKIFNLGNKQWKIPELVKLLHEILPKKDVITNYIVSHKFKEIGNKVMSLNARKLVVDPKTKDQLILLAIEDISQEYYDKSLLEASELKYRTIFQTSSNCIMSLTSEGVISEASDHASILLGFPLKNIVGKKIISFINKKYITKFHHIMHLVLKGEKVGQEEITFVKKGKGKLNMVANMTLLKNSNPNKSRVIGLFYDITKSKTAEVLMKNYQTKLEYEIAKQTKELTEKLEEAAKFQSMVVGRELKMVELKEIIRKLQKQLASK
ncbi:hypothetical protein COY27_05470 [Candidatus Woesearchaeota archaeon CG_4_10_14_0_2_um_filter_33_13]|nr:MAG: hypothetical protein COY27_05470 [Candidatus Woesearchaeota archaeon CG_4_10_14_0_2_um_filter_33_13]